jgi:hypothetical protein
MQCNANGVNFIEMKVFFAVEQALPCCQIACLDLFHCLGLLEGTEEDREYPDFRKGITEPNLSR